MTLLFRTDASIAIGTGHVMRCLALAQSWQDVGGRAAFAMAESVPGVEARLAAESCKVLSVSCAAGTEEDSLQTIALARRCAANWIVVDGYQFTAAYQRALKTAGFKVLFLDDYAHAAPYSADLVLNQNPHANEKMYSAREGYTQLLLGCEHCLLRREFASWRDWKRTVAAVGSRVLVTMGGSDPENVTAKVIESLRRFTVEVNVVIGSSNPWFSALQQSTSEPGDRFRFLNNPADMPELMAWADVAIAGAGTTCWEMCFLQLPMALIDVADNQKPIAYSLKELGAAVHLGTARNVTEKEIAKGVMSLLTSRSERIDLSRRCGILVDGRGTERVLSKLTRG